MKTICIINDFNPKLLPTTVAIDNTSGCFSLTPEQSLLRFYGNPDYEIEIIKNQHNMLSTAIVRQVV